MGRYAASQGELPWRRGHEEAMRAKVPGKKSLLTSRCPTQSWSGFGWGESQRSEYATVQGERKGGRTAIRVNMSNLSDSGFEEELQSPSPSHQQFRRTWSGHSGDTLTTECLHYDETCFTIQRDNQEDFLALDCLAGQPQVTGAHLKTFS